MHYICARRVGHVTHVRMQQILQTYLNTYILGKTDAEIAGFFATLQRQLQFLSV